MRCGIWLGRGLIYTYISIYKSMHKVLYKICECIAAPLSQHRTVIWKITHVVFTGYFTCTYVYIHNYFTHARGHHPLINMTINTKAPNTASGIQSGERTHHQLHVDTIPTSANLSVKKMRNSMVPTPMPFDLLLSFICLLNLSYCLNNTY